MMNGVNDTNGTNGTKLPHRRKISKANGKEMLVSPIQGLRCRREL